jgi:hypothetical protein
VYSPVYRGRGGVPSQAYKETLNTFRLIVRMKEVKKVTRNDSLLNAYLGDPDFIPAAGGGWRWAYCTKMVEGGQE